MYLIQTVSSRPRAWSSYTNVSTKNEDHKRLKSMNSVEEIAKYSEDTISYYSPTLERRTLAATTYDFPENPTPPAKKDKKWSLGSLFRRKKKEESDSSSEDDTKKTFLTRRKRKADKKRKSKTVGTFDHIVLPVQQNRISQVNGYYDDTGGVLSDPTGGFGAYPGRPLPRVPLSDLSSTQRGVKSSKEGLDHDGLHSRNSMGSVDSLGRKTRKDRAKLRAQARREQLGHNSSSDDDSQRSVSSSRIRSDENLVGRRDGSFSKRSRGARTERYIRRLSRDEENIINKEAQLRTSKSDVEHQDRSGRWRVVDDAPKKSPVLVANPPPKTKVSPVKNQQSFSGVSTIPPSHTSLKNRASSFGSSRTPRPKEYYPNSITTSNCDFNSISSDLNLPNQRSISYDSNINKSNEFDNGVIHGQLPVRRPASKHRNLSLVEQPRLITMDRVDRQPPPPPPRDPKRLMQQSESNGNGRPLSQYFHQNNRVPTQKPLTRHEVNKSKSLNWHPGYRSTSEDHIPMDILPHAPMAPRPSSVTPDQKYLRRQPESLDSSENYQYLTDKNPRSRKPIFIQSNSQDSTKNALSFWKQKDQEEVNRSQDRLSRKSQSPQMFTAQTHVRTNIFLPSVLRSDVDNLLNPGVDVVDAPREPSPFKPISPISKSGDTNSTTSSLDSKSKYNYDVTTKYKNPEPKFDLTKPNNKKSTSPTPLSERDDSRKSTNLEDALDELEAIYQSLHLGDEDLLERAEQREMSMATQKLLESKSESYPGWIMSRGALSDSSFSYEPFDSVDSPRKKRMLKRSRAIDRKTDDMAFRKLNKERSNTINDPQSVISKVSYLLTSPVHGLNPDEVEREEKDDQEPDITLDDVVYRSIKHTNNFLKVSEPQPPFGIPIGPITTAANSDYLHAVPENSPRYSFKNKKIPDIVKDDLAFRNLRKDSNKAPSLPNHNEENDALNALKKKRAVRSLSANISNLIQRNASKRPNGKCKEDDPRYENEFYKPDIDDIADAMEIARKILKEKDNKIANTRRAFLSDSDAKYMHNRDLISPSKDLSDIKMNFLNGLKDASPEDSDSLQQKIQVYIPLLGDDYLESKPPRGLTPDRKTREATPIPAPRHIRSEGKDTYNSSLEELLSALEVEARETSERISSELRDLESQKKQNESGPKDVNDNKLEETLSEIDSVCEHAKLCEKLLECVAESTEMVASPNTETVKEEEVEQLEPIVQESVVNIVLTPEEKQENGENPVEVEVFSDPDYENIHGDEEKSSPSALIEDFVDEEKPSKSPFEEHKAELVAGFQELNHIEDVTRKENDGPKMEPSGDPAEKEDSGGEKGVLECALHPLLALPPSNLLSPSYVSICEIVLNSETEKTESEPSSGFHSITQENTIQEIEEICNKNLEQSQETFMKVNYEYDMARGPDSLKSPKLVLNSANKLEEFRRSQENLLVDCPAKEGLLESESGFESSKDYTDDAESRPELNVEHMFSSKVDNFSDDESTGNSFFTKYQEQMFVEEDVSDESSSTEFEYLQSLDQCNGSDSDSLYHECNNLKDNSESPATSSSSQSVSPNHQNSQALRPRPFDTFRNSPPNFGKTFHNLYRDPIMLAFACSYGFACTYQMASLDVVAIIGLIFVILSFISAIVDFF